MSTQTLKYAAAAGLGAAAAFAGLRLHAGSQSLWSAQRLVTTASQASPKHKAQKVKVALCQLKVTDNKQANIDNARSAIKDAASNGAQLVVLPEIWNGPYANASFPVFAEDIDAKQSPSVDMLSVAALENGITLVGGSIPERSGGNLYNTCCVFGRDGKLLAKHRKVHLFDIDIPGKITFKESDVLSPGQSGTIVDTDAGRIGIGICYDIRFPELAMLYAARGVQLIVYPGAFNTTTGPAHWELLQRARAVDNQLFVATCSPARSPESSYQAWGHSMAVSPFGSILATIDEHPGTVYADLDYAEVEEHRSNMPISQQKRHDLYELRDKLG